MRRALSLFLLVGLLSLPAFAGSSQYLFANNATFGNPYVYEINASTGAIVNTFTNLESFNGRGVIDVNNILYYTDASDGNVYKYDISTQTQLGTAFSVSGASALASITFDGTNFWIGDYSGSNKAFEYSPNGTLLNTITLSHCTSYCDGLTYFLQNGTPYLLSNEFDGGYGGPNSYDVYTLNGTFVKTLFTSTSSASTGVAWDGTHFWTSNIFDGTITEWDMNGNQLATITLTGAPANYPPLIEGMSFNFAQTLNLVPEPSSLLMLGSGMLGLAGMFRRKLRK